MSHDVQVHGVVRHVHYSSHFGIMVSWGRDCCFTHVYYCITSCVFVGFKCIGYLVYNVVMSSYAEAFYVRMCACG
jgi:hypothetical protein